MKPTCAYADCTRPLDDKGGRGLCARHYGLVRRHGKLDQYPRTQPEFESTLDRFLSKVEVTGFCWLWVGGYLNPQGYATFQAGGRGTPPKYAHRWIYEQLVGPIPEGLHLDHLCRIPRCVNPDHLEPVTQSENNRRKPRKTHCIRGHDLNDGYVRKDGSRMCTECMRINAKNRGPRIRNRKPRS